MPTERGARALAVPMAWRKGVAGVPSTAHPESHLQLSGGPWAPWSLCTSLLSDSAPQSHGSCHHTYGSLATS